jgi:hypothetical protein
MTLKPAMALAALLASAVVPALAQMPGVRDMVVVSGSCPRFTVSGISYPCKAAVYSHHRNGRTALQFDTPSGAIMLSGGSDSQVDPRRYILNVDTVRVAHSGQSRPYRARGRCVVTVTDASGDYVRSISCAATNGTERIDVDFRGDGRKVEKVI